MRQGQGGPNRQRQLQVLQRHGAAFPRAGPTPHGRSSVLSGPTPTGAALTVVHAPRTRGPHAGCTQAGPPQAKASRRMQECTHPGCLYISTLSGLCGAANSHKPPVLLPPCRRRASRHPLFLCQHFPQRSRLAHSWSPLVHPQASLQHLRTFATRHHERPRDRARGIRARAATK